MTKETWSEFAEKKRSQALQELHGATVDDRMAVYNKARGAKDIWYQIGGQPVLGRDGRLKQHAKKIAARFEKEKLADASNYINDWLVKRGFKKATVDGLGDDWKGFNIKRRLISEIGHGTLQSSKISAVSREERESVVKNTSEFQRRAARPFSFNPLAGRGMKTWSYYEQASLKAGGQPDLLPDVLLTRAFRGKIPDFVTYPGGVKPAFKF